MARGSPSSNGWVALHLVRVALAPISVNVDALLQKGWMALHLVVLAPISVNVNALLQKVGLEPVEASHQLGNGNVVHPQVPNLNGKDWRITCRN